MKREESTYKKIIYFSELFVVITLLIAFSSVVYFGDDATGYAIKKFTPNKIVLKDSFYTESFCKSGSFNSFFKLCLRPSSVTVLTCYKVGNITTGKVLDQQGYYVTDQNGQDFTAGQLGSFKDYVAISGDGHCPYKKSLKDHSCQCNAVFSCTNHLGTDYVVMSYLNCRKINY